MKNYDVVVVGAGPAGIFTCYELATKAPYLKVLLMDKGRNIYKRVCPILQKSIVKCPPPTQKKEYAGCMHACSITNGFGGAGAYSDGKFNITTEFGGWLTDYLPHSEVLELINYVDGINIKHGAVSAATDPTTPAVKAIEKRGLGAGLKLLRAQVRHLGTEQNLEILKNIYEYLKNQVDMLFETEVENLLTTTEGDKHLINGVVARTGEEFFAKKVVIAPGRDGSEWLSGVLKKHSLEVDSNQVDVGVRVETLNAIMEEINEHLYEGKFVFRTSVGTTVRTFCSNPAGTWLSKITAASCWPTATPIRTKILAATILILPCWCRKSSPIPLISPLNTPSRSPDWPTICPTAVYWSSGMAIS
ncbi:FAD-dependent oxidoreductase [Desulforamulus profundi]|uniref:FAD-dependent oxidoreductase n=1 Tax=Desulforamulus profundi TaxID=1383067 RepID=A0A2C6MHY1_9FIRM|nr:FAD-dependent oxidoreductase [Desulforamulus profundi]